MADLSTTTTGITGVAGSGDPAEDPTTGLLRRALLGIAGVTVLGTALELLSLQHWKEPSQIIPFACLAALAVAIGLLLGRPSAAVVRAARAVAVVVCLASAFGMVQHVHGNYEAGPLDAVYGEEWDTLSVATRWWYALVKTVGPSPALAPGVLALASLCVVGATLRHPALRTAAAD